MKRAYLKSDVFGLVVLALFPLAAYLEPLLAHRLLGPGDGVALHLPLRTEAFRAYREWSWPFLNTGEFLGTPLLGAYRGGVLYPLTILLSPFDPFSAFQALVVISLSLAGLLTYLYLKRLGAGAAGAFVGALSFAYGPYLLSHFEDTATLVAAPMLPLVMLAAESHMNRATSSRLAGLGVSIALLVLAGSPEALRAGAILLFGRLLLGHTLGRSERTPSRLATAMAILIGLALSAPQWLPTLELLPEAGRQVTGLAAENVAESVPGLAGLILMTVTHTPAASLALASLPLLVARLPVRVLLLAVLSSLALQVGRGPLLAPGALPLVLEFALAALAGLALDEQWRERRTPRGRTLRAYFLVASLASVGVLSIAAATLGGLPEHLAAAVGVYAIALITYFALAAGESDVAAGVFLLPLAVSFALQPSGREVFKDAPTRSQLVAGTPTRHAVDLALAELGPAPRVLSLVRSFPSESALDLGFAGYGALAGRVQANGYDPMAPVSVRRTVGEMGARGFLTERSLTPDPALLREWSIDAVQVLATDLLRSGEDPGFEVSLEPGVPRVFALPYLRLKSITLTFDSTPRSPVRVSARVNGSREVPLGVIRPSAPVSEITSPAYRTDAIIVEALAADDEQSAPPARLRDLKVETQEGPTVEASRLSAYLSQGAFQEIAPTPLIRVFRLTRALTNPRGPTVPRPALAPGGRLTFDADRAQNVDLPVPYLPGWTGSVPLEDVSGRIRARIETPGPVRLSYAPRLFFPSLIVAFLGFLSVAFLLVRPEIVGALLKTRREERK